MTQKRLSIGALTDHSFTPSSRFRIRQLIPTLKSIGIDLVDFPRKYSSQNLHSFLPHLRIRESPLKIGYAAVQEIANLIHSAKRLYAISDFDYSIISREIVVGYPTFESFAPNNIIYDIDDAIFLSGPLATHKTRKLLEVSKVVFAGNNYIAEWCKNYSENVNVLPTAVDTNRFHPCGFENVEKFVVGWSGTSSSFKYLLGIENQLLNFFETHKDAIFSICSDRYPSELSKLKKFIRFEKWSELNEVSQIQKFSVGIMPVDREEWALGKCSYKMLLYLSCSIPCCVTSWGMNTQILSQGRVGLGITERQDWSEALDYLYKSRYELQSIFPDCRSVVIKYYSLDVVANSFKCALLQRTAL